MIIEVKNLSFDASNGDVVLEIFSENTIGAREFLLQKRQSSSNLRLYEGVILKCHFNNDIANLKFNVNDIIDPSTIQPEEDMWDCFLLHGEEKLGLIFPKEIPNQFKYHMLKYNDLFKVIPYITKGTGTLAFYIRPIDLKGILKNITFERGIVEGALELTSADKDISSFKTILCYKKREKKDVFDYYDSIEMEIEKREDSWIFKSDLNKVFTAKYENNIYWDMFVKIVHQANEISIPLINMNTPLTGRLPYYMFEQNDFFQVKPITTEENIVAIHLKYRDFKVLINSILQEGNNLSINGIIYLINQTSLNGKYSLISKLRREVGSSFEYYSEVVIPIESNNLKFNINISYEELLTNPREKDIWDLFIRIVDEKGIEIDLPLSPKNNIRDQKYIASSRIATLFVNSLGTYSLWINLNKQFNNSATNVAILGTCFSRNAFNSSDYFNPQYKKLYKCIYTQFHSSVISLVSNPVDFNMEDWKAEGLKQSDINYIQSDFTKSFFENLKNYKPEYLIIDFYVDACREVIQLGDNQFITLNYLIPGTKFYKNLQGCKVVSHLNNKEYFSLWKSSLDKFADELLSIIPENKIILNRGRLTQKYRDVDNKIKEYSEKGIIKRNNDLWDKMENYFLYKMPNVKIIDMQKTKYTGYYKHPFGNTYAHYESGYYKEFMNKLNEIVLEDKINY
ncbi:DUF6270 domain-containing protein [Bacillus toyonensis]|uniref:DUF6270 domain-containing protein n=1 Tax=Bacillus toyonensis TaxID=155322 RepID=UPI000BF2ABDD|nr:DUF6270 domain-containing protein [Bacillus toyonensis]PGD05772.1 hypothetical protein COM31_05255 [Bacillus toyonensis]